MNTSHRRWLLEQLPKWEQEQLLTADSLRVLRERYAVDESEVGLAQMVMGVLGALLIGAGLIAVIGYNWDDFSRPVRLLFAFMPLLLTQLFSFRVLRGGQAIAAWVRETAALLQALATGACIALISQIYHLGGEWPDFLFWWFLLSLPLTWVLRSNAVAIFYVIAIAIWSVNQVERGRPWQDSPLIYPLLLLGLLPYWPGLPPRMPLPVSLRWVMTLSAIPGLCSAAIFVCVRDGTIHGFGYDDDAFIWLWTLIAAALVLFPLNQAGIHESTGRKPQVVLGTLWLLGYGMAATFHDLNNSFIRGVSRALKLPWCWGLLAVLAAFAFLAFKQRRWSLLGLASIATLPLVAGELSQAGIGYGNLLAWLVTLHLSIIGLLLILFDFYGSRGSSRLGALMLSMLIIARMADSHFSLLIKGLVFIAVGVAFLAFNFFMSRRHRPAARSNS